MQIQKSTQEEITLWVLGGTHCKLCFHLYTAIKSLFSTFRFYEILNKVTLTHFTTPKELEYWAASLYALFCVYVRSRKLCVRSFIVLPFSAKSSQWYEWKTHLEVFLRGKIKYRKEVSLRLVAIGLLIYLSYFSYLLSGEDPWIFFFA
jgi:hypothetical protein